MKLTVKLDAESILSALKNSPRAVAAALRKAGMTALRDMRSEASKRIRKRKALKAGVIGKAFTLSRPRGGVEAQIAGEWTLRVSGKPLPLINYPHRMVSTAQDVQAKGRNKGRHQGLLPVESRSVGRVEVEVNKGKRTVLGPRVFIARMASGHEGIFMREKNAKRLPIHQLYGSRPVDALLHAGEASAVAERGAKSFTATFERLLPFELAKLDGGRLK